MKRLTGLVNEVSSLNNTGWLDDIGLPQYKDQFHEARVDGRMIQYLTVVRHEPSSLVLKVALCICNRQKINSWILSYYFNIITPVPSE